MEEFSSRVAQLLAWFDESLYRSDSLKTCPPSPPPSNSKKKKEKKKKLKQKQEPTIKNPILINNYDIVCLTIPLVGLVLLFSGLFLFCFFCFIFFSSGHMCWKMSGVGVVSWAYPSLLHAMQ